MEGPLLEPAPLSSVLAHPLHQPAGPGCSLTTGLCMSQFQPYCPLPLLAMAHSPAHTQPPTWPSVTPLACGQLSQGQGQGTEQLVLQPSKALVICSRPSSGETQNRTGRSPYLQSPPCWGHPREPFWGSHQLLHKCPGRQLTATTQSRQAPAPVPGGLLKAALGRYSLTNGSRRGWGRGV